VGNLTAPLELFNNHFLFAFSFSIKEICLALSYSHPEKIFVGFYNLFMPFGIKLASYGLYNSGVISLSLWKSVEARAILQKRFLSILQTTSEWWSSITLELCQVHTIILFSAAICNHITTSQLEVGLFQSSKNRNFSLDQVPQRHGTNLGHIIWYSFHLHTYRHTIKIFNLISLSANFHLQKKTLFSIMRKEMSGIEGIIQAFNVLGKTTSSKRLLLSFSDDDKLTSLMMHIAW